MSNEYRRIEVITGDVRRRRWTTEQKLQIIEESFEAGETRRPPGVMALRPTFFIVGAGC